jgi:hypothetical protein
MHPVYSAESQVVVIEQAPQLVVELDPPAEGPLEIDGAALSTFLDELSQPRLDPFRMLLDRSS